MTEHEDPAAHASAKGLQWVALAATAAEALAQVAAARRQAAAGRSSREAGAARAELRARYGRDALAWAPMLDPRKRDAADLDVTRRAWAAAQAWAGDPEAEQAAKLAEDRLRVLRPDVMRLYDREREQGRNPVDAMRDVGERFDGPEARVGEPARVRPQLPSTAAPEAAEVEVRGATVLTMPVREQTGIWEHADTARSTAAGTAGPRPRVIDAEVIRSVSVESVDGYWPEPIAGAVRVTGAATVAQAPAPVAQTVRHGAHGLGR